MEVKIRIAFVGALIVSKQEKEAGGKAEGKSGIVHTCAQPSSAELDSTNRDLDHICKTSGIFAFLLAWFGCRTDFNPTYLKKFL